jgi:hypothetical protein
MCKEDISHPKLKRTIKENKALKLTQIGRDTGLTTAYCEVFQEIRYSGIKNICSPAYNCFEYKGMGGGKDLPVK